MNAGPFQPVLDSFHLHLNAEGKSENTATIYVEATSWFAGAHLREKTDHTDWSQVTAEDIQRWIVYLRKFGYADSYVNNQYRALQQFFRWWSEEEDLPNPMARWPGRVRRRPAEPERTLAEPVALAAHDFPGPPVVGNERPHQGPEPVPARGSDPPRRVPRK